VATTPSLTPAKPSVPATTPAVWGALAGIYLIWGSTYLAIRVMVETVPPALGSAMRFLVAGVLMLAILAIRGRGTKPGIRIPAGQLVRCAIIGTLLAAGGNGLVTIGERGVPSGLAALLIASTPLWIVVFVSIAGKRPSRATLAGVALGFVGVILLLAPGGRPGHVPLGLALIIVVAGMSWALGSVLSQRFDMPSDPLVATAWGMLFGGLVMLAGGLIAGEGGNFSLDAFSTKSILALAYLIVLGAIVGYSCYGYLLEHAPLSLVSTYAYVNPVIAVILGAIVLGEGIAPLTVLGMVLVVGAVAITIRQRDVIAPQPD
jgi:drug/metabolite transporter (DMT)-like permease